MANLREKDIHKKKAVILKSLMSNPKLSRLLRDSLSSPLGSTKREQAKSIVAIMSKMGGNDGRGGMGSGTLGVPMPYPQAMMPSYNQNHGSMMIYPAAPRFKEKQKMSSPDGKGGLGDFSTNPIDYSKLTVGSPTQPNSSVLSALSGVSLPSSYDTNVSQPKNYSSPNYSSFSLSPQTDYSKLTVGGPSIPHSSAMSGIDPSAFTLAPQTSNTGSDLLSYSTPGTEILSPTLDVAKLIRDSRNQSTQPSSSSPVATSQYSSPQGPITEPPVTPTIPTPQEPTGPTRPLTDVEKATAAFNQGKGPGAATFALEEAKRRMFPGVPDDKLPIGTGLGEKIDEIDQTLRKENNLEALRNNLSRVTQMKGDITPTLKNYISGRDEYLSSINKMIDDANGSVLKQDLGNPEVAKQYQNYVDYLYTLKGRQNQRYGDYLNSSIEHYNSDLNNATNVFNSAQTAYENALNRKSTIAQNEYNTLYSTLSDAYNTVADAETKQLNLDILRDQQKDVHNKMMKNSLEGGGLDYEEMAKYKDQIVDKDGYLIPYLNLVETANNLSSGGYGLSGVFQTMKNGMVAKLYSSAGDINKLMGDTTSYRDKISELARVPAYSVSAVAMMDELALRSGESINKYIVDANNIDNVKNAAYALVKGKGPLPNKDTWEADHTGVNKSLLSDIYDYADRTLKAAPTMDRNLLFTDTGTINNARPQDFADNISKGLAEGLMGNVRRISLGSIGDSKTTQNVPQKNKNPLNIKYSTATSTYPGVTGIDTTQAKDGGNFLTFDSVESGFAAAKRLIQSDSYKDLTVDAALKRWSNNGYGGEIVPDMKTKVISKLTPQELDPLIKAMAQREGFINT